MDALSESLHDVLERTDLGDAGVTAEQGMVESMIGKTQSVIANAKANLYSHDWDEGIAAKVKEQEAQLQSLIARREAYTAERATEEALRAEIHDWDAFMSHRTPEELRDLYHTAIRRIDVDFAAGVALVHWTFTLTTSRIDLVREKKRARARARAMQKCSIDATCSSQKGQVVEPRGFEPLTSSVRGMRSPS